MKIFFTTIFIFSFFSAFAQEVHENSDSDLKNYLIEYVKAFSNHDIESMLEKTTDDIKWFSVIGDSTLLETSGKEELKESMERYFNSVPSVRSEISDIFTLNPFVIFKEKVYWQSNGNELTQESLAIYEFREDKIVRAWYYFGE